MTWKKRGPVIGSPPNTAGNDHTGYLRVNRFGDYWLGYHLMGDDSSSGWGVSYSSNGVGWAPLADERSLVGPTRPLVEPTLDWEGNRTYSPDLSVEDGTVYVLYATQTGSIRGGGQEAIDGHIGGARIQWTEDGGGA